MIILVDACVTMDAAEFEEQIEVEIFEDATAADIDEIVSREVKEWGNELHVYSIQN